MRFSPREHHAFRPLNLSKVNCKAIDTATGKNIRKTYYLGTEEGRLGKQCIRKDTWEGFIKRKNRFGDLSLKGCVSSRNTKHDKILWWVVRAE